MSFFSKVKFRISIIIQKLTFSPIKYWEKRAKQHGELSVLNVNYSAAEVASVKKSQIDILFPLLKAELSGEEKYLLDFGCGTGRFTVDLAKLTNCKVSGVDPIEHLLSLAPNADNVTYLKLIGEKIPAADKSFDIIWICLVLGGITSERKLRKIVKELIRIKNKDCLLFLVENTTSKKNQIYWKYRSSDTYIKLFSSFNLNHIKDYYEIDERISIFAGRSKRR